MHLPYGIHAKCQKRLHSLLIGLLFSPIRQSYARAPFELDILAYTRIYAHTYTHTHTHSDHKKVALAAVRSMHGDVVSSFELDILACIRTY